MLNDKVTVVTNPAKRMDRACKLASARAFRLRLARSALAAAVASLLPLHAAAQVGQGAAPEIEVADKVRDFDLPAGKLAVALEAFSTQSGIRLDSQPGLLVDKQARAVNGRMSWREALGELLQGSGLEYRQTGDTTAVIATAGEGAASADGPTRARPETTTPQAAVTLEAVTVTGTRIRGGTSPSPVITIGSEQIQEEGFADLGEVVRSIPQNFSGGQNPGVAVGATLGAGGRGNQNITGGSSLNLRGLGSDATLTLLNGRRLAYGGFVQAVDISAIPVEAVDRLEIVPDGASAIYGSDAVGGVGNVILKRDYEGVTLGARHGNATEGGLATREYSVTAGTTWSSGGLIATYKDVSTDPIYARQRDYTEHMFDPTTLHPGSDLRSGLVSLHQSIADSVELRLDALRTEREQDMYQWNTGLAPWYNRVTPTTTTSLVSPSMEVSLAGDWTLSISGSQGTDKHVQRQSRVNIATGVPTTIVHECYCNEIVSYEVGAEGPLFTLPAGNARLAVGAGYRRNEYRQRNYITDVIDTQGDESSRFAYAEVNLPLIGPDSNIAGARRLDLTAAVRGEDYDSFGSVTTPKLGLIYGPNADFTLKVSWGKSFKAPTLFERYWSRYAVLDPASYYGGTDYGPDATVFTFGGGNPDLGAERATTRAVSLALHPESLPGLEAELTWFDIDYTDRVVQPITDYGRALHNPNYAQFIDYSPTAQAQEDLLSAADIFYNLIGRPYDPDDVVAIIYEHYVNVARQRIKGLDLSASYRFDLGSGRLTIRGSSSWLDSSQQISAAEGAYDVAGTIFNPAEVSSRVGAVWNQGGFVASAFVNYTGGVTNTVNREKTASFTTFDATLRYATDRRSDYFSGLEIALSAQNLFNREPPLYAALTLDRPPYDSTNYSAIGRFLSLSVSKHW